MAILNWLFTGRVYADVRVNRIFLVDENKTVLKRRDGSMSGMSG